MWNELICAPPSRCAVAESAVPNSPGYYAIFIDDSRLLPDPFRARLGPCANKPIYVGIATRSLQRRLVSQDLRHQSPSTFFRSLGAVLGFRPPPGSLAHRRRHSNYRFNPPETTDIVRWINAHASVRWIEDICPQEIYERKAIARLRPILNLKHNPQAIEMLKELRDECRKIARALTNG